LLESNPLQYDDHWKIYLVINRYKIGDQLYNIIYWFNQCL